MKLGFNLIIGTVLVGYSFTAVAGDCTRYALDLETHVDLLKQKVKIVEQQRDQAIAEGSTRQYPDYFWVVMGAFVGTMGAVYFIRK